MGNSKKMRVRTAMKLDADKDVQAKAIKPKSSAERSKAGEIEMLDQEEQDRITEKLSLSVPVAPLAARPRPILGRFLGQRVRLLLRDGNVIVGTVRLQQWDFVRLENVVEESKDCRISASFVMVDVSSIVRIYPANVQIETKAGAA